MNNSLLIGVAALLIGGTGGYVIGNAGTAGGTSADRDPVPGSKGTRVRVESGSVVSGSSRSAKLRSFSDIMQEPGQTRRLQSLLDFYADLDPAEFASEAEKLDDLPFSDRMLAGALLFSRWAEVAPQEAMAYAQSMGRGGFFVRPTIIRSWASSDPVAAARYYQENPNEFGGFGGRWGNNSAGQIAGEWAKQDPQSALEWSQDLNEQDRSSAVRNIFREMAQNDPAKAAEMAAGLEASQQEDAYTSIARSWGGQDWAAAEQWIAALPNDRRENAMAEAIRGLAGEDPVLASSKVTSLSDESAIDDAVRSVARNWSQDDPAAAAEWLVNQDTNELGPPMSQIMRNWVAQDQVAALEYLDSQPAGDLRDTAAQSYVRANRSGDVQESLAVAQSIQDDDARSQAVSVAAIRWWREDEAAATQFINESPDISDDQADRIIRRAQGRRR